MGGSTNAVLHLLAMAHTVNVPLAIDDFEKLGTWFWEETKAGRLILCLAAVSLESENRILKQIVDMSLITPRFWSEGPLPGSSGSGW